MSSWFGRDEAGGVGERFGSPRHRRAVELVGELEPPGRFVLALCANVPTVLKVGWHEPLLNATFLNIAQWMLLAVYGLSLVLWPRLVGRTRSQRRELLQVTRPEQVVVALGLVSVGWPVGVKLAAALLLMFQLPRMYLRLVQTRIPAGLVFLGSFIALVAVGTSALMLPAATPRGHPIGVIDALFTITSAISQTGLVVRPTGAGFTRLGQIIILVWIQVGALGVIVFGALLVGVIGRSFSLRATQTIAEGTEQGWAGQLSLQRLVSFIIIFTHVVELAGAVVLYYGWPRTWEGAPPGIEHGVDRFYHAVFFSVSAFCNAGFVTTENSMVTLRTAWTSHLVIVPLIVLGSIGFPVLENIRRVVWARVRGVRHEGGRLIRLSLNSKIVLVTTVWVYLAGFGLIFVSEAMKFDVFHLGAETPLWEIGLDAHFMNINRTAGFATIDPRAQGVLAQLGLVFLMFVGGSPGSVAGGIKMMVLAVLVLTVWCTLRGREHTTIFGRTIPDEIVRKSATLIVLMLMVQLTITGILAITEEARGHPFGQLLFETTSALGTCGLSLGVTDDLTVGGKLALSVAMFLGRVGPFAVMAALLSAGLRHRTLVEYPTEEVVIY